MKFILSALAAIAAANTNADDTTGIFPNTEAWKTGLVNIDNHDDIFYWMFQSRKETYETDPLILWMTGGPGCASEVALFYENGPFKFNEDGTFASNPYSWNEIGNLLYVDQPIGTGYSHAAVGQDVRNEAEVAEDMAIFLRGFVEQNPEFAGRDFYITGESYAGHYVPAIAYYLENVATDVDLDLKAIAIGNGLTDPFAQYPAYAPFAYENDLISEEWFHTLQAGLKGCQGLIYEAESGPRAGLKLEIAALEFCSILSDTILGNPTAPKFNVYDIRIPCEDPPLCYDFSQSDEFLNREDVQALLGVSGRKWEECDMMVHTYLTGDWMLNLMPQVADMLDNTDLQVLVYSGDKDFVCNWRGGEAWTLATKWANKEEFNAQDYEEWTVEGQSAGAMRQYENFHFLRVYDAGHMVPMDQPQNALAMLQRFIDNDWNLASEAELLQ